MLENIYHRIEEGEPPLAAAFNGARQVGFAIVSTTMVVCAVFVPIMFIAGQTGLLFRELAAAMIGAVAFSGFFAFSLAPMLCSKLLRHEERGRLAGWIERPLPPARGSAMPRRLDWVLRKPLIPLAVVALFLAASGALFFLLRSELVPAEDAGILQANITAPEGHQLRRDEPLHDRGRRRGCCRWSARARCASLIIRAPGGFGPSDDFNNGAIAVFLKPWEERDVTTAADGRPGQPRARPDPGGARQRPGPQLARTAAAASRSTSSSPAPTYPDLARARDRILAAAGAQSRHRQPRQRL